MRSRLLLTVCVLSAGLAISSTAYADSAAISGEGASTATDNSNNSVNTPVDLKIDTTTDNSLVSESYNEDSSVMTQSAVDLAATVTGNSLEIGPDPSEGGTGLATGAIQYEGGSFAGFAGIQTTGANTGFASVNQAATSLAANASISFGSN